MLVDHSQLFEPLDLCKPAARDAGVVRRIAEAGMRLQQRAVLTGKLVEPEDQLVGSIIEAAERGAGAQKWIAGAGEGCKHALRALERHLGILDHALGQDPKN